jgi:uncharacterized protein YecE (DUF72 family)
MARLLVGLPSLLGDVSKYGKRFDMVELRPVDTSTPRPATLRAWRKAVPPGFVFSVVLPAAVGKLATGKELDSALTSALEVATLVEARCIVLPTPASVRPTAAHKKRIAQLLEKLPHDGVQVCWEPHGIWEAREMITLARSAGALLVVDAARDTLPPGPIAYTRLRALGKGSKTGTATLDRVADQLRGRREAFVVVEGAAEAARVKTALRTALARRKMPGAAPVVVRPGSSSSLIAEDEEQ